MKTEDIRARCACWRVELPERAPDVVNACACAARCDCAARRRVLGTLALLAIFTVAGAAVGLAGARRDNSRNLASLREVYLDRLAMGSGAK